MKTRVERPVDNPVGTAGEVRRKRLLQVVRAGWVLLFLVGCGTYNPAPGGTPAPATATAAGVSPVTGAVQIEQGRCCTGGVAGSTIQVPVQFSAASLSGTVSNMRVETRGGTCNAASSVDAADWEPFAASKTYPVIVAINWTSFSASVQFRDDRGNLSPVYCADISVEGMPAAPAVNPTDWYSQIQCFSENEVHPSPGEIVTEAPATFRWPDKNQLPDGVFYKVNVYGAADQYTALIASGQTRDTSLRLDIPRDRAGDVVWYITLVDANGTLLDHGRCSSFAASLLTVNPPSGIKGIHFTYQP